jgi:RNA polymerase sigma factor (sigma-70 family)
MFPTTRSSAVADLLSGDPQRHARSLEIISRAYWKPACKYLRLRWRSTPEQAEDLAQSFFETALRRDLLAAYQPGRGRFRSFFRTCLDRHAIDHYRRTHAARRGGGAAELDIDEQPVAGPDGEAPDTLFEAEWLRHLMQLAIDELDRALAADGKPIHAALFRQFHIGDDAPSYAEAAAQHGISVTDVTNWLHVARKAFRKVALELLAELTLDEDDYAEEAMAVFGIDVRKDVK